MQDSTPDDITEFDVDDTSPGDIDFEVLRDALTDEEGFVRDHATDICLSFADENVESIGPVMPSLVTALSDENVNVVLKAATTINLIAEQDPDGLRKATGPLVDLFDHDVPRVQLFSAKACQSIGVEHPEWFVPHVEGLLLALQNEIDDPMEGIDSAGGEQITREVRHQHGLITHEARENQLIGQSVASNLLVAVARENPEAVAPHTADLVKVIEMAQPNVAADIVDVISTVAESDPAAFDDARDDAIDALSSRLESDADFLVARTVRALGFLEAESAVRSLRDLADDGARDEDLREMATETADWLERES